MDDVTIDRLGECARWSLRAPSSCSHDFSSMEINRCMQAGQRLAARLGPDEWLVCRPLGLSDFKNLEGKHHSLVDVGHRYAAFAVAGPQAHAVLAAGCPLDLDPSVFIAGSATRTLLGKAEIVLWRPGDAPAWRVECARSFAPYVGAFLQEAAREWDAIR